MKNISKTTKITIPTIQKTGIFQSEEFLLEKMSRFLVLHRTRPYWNDPLNGTKYNKIPAETQFLLWERKDGLYGVCLPLLGSDDRATIKGVDNGIVFVIEGALKRSTEKNTTAAIVVVGDNPYAIIHEAILLVKKELGSFKLRTEKDVPKYLDYIGWCTWDLFHKEIDEEKLLDCLTKFKEKSFTPKYIILDDGWEDKQTDRMLLKGFEANEEKFPNGLKSTVKKVKNLGVKYVGIWHALQGYWDGLDPESDFGKNYEQLPTPVEKANGEKTERVFYMIKNSEINRFYNDFHASLAESGIDFLKVDNQTSLEWFLRGHYARGETYTAWQIALQDSVEKHFNKQNIHCMAMCTDIIYNMYQCNVLRNSEDYNIPEKDINNQQYHINMNAKNSLFSAEIAIPDWDMFESHAECASFHAATKAISGGPIMFSDNPDLMNLDLIKSLCLEDGTILRCENPALPCVDSLFKDCLKEDTLLKLYNNNNDIGVLGIFHCNENDKSINDSWSPSMNPKLKVAEFAVWHYQAQKLEKLSLKQTSEIKLDKADWEILTLSPIKNNFAPLGLLDKINGSNAIISYKQVAENKWECIMKAGGKIGFYSKTKPKEIIINGKQIKFSYNEKEHLLMINHKIIDKLNIQIKGYLL